MRAISLQFRASSSGAVLATLVASALTLSCESAPTTPDSPTWADVEPILRGSCTHCHGATAAQTGASSGIAYRLDFYDPGVETCGEAAAALPPGQGFARAWAALIGSAVTSPGGGWRARMPPSPAEVLPEWQRATLAGWAAQTVPAKGEPRNGNRRPEIQLSGGSATADKRLTFTAVVTDSDGEAVAGVLKVGDALLHMDRAGAFTADIDTSSWLAGTYAISAVLCDGWDSVTYPLGNAQVLHGSSSK